MPAIEIALVDQPYGKKIPVFGTYRLRFRQDVVILKQLSDKNILTRLAGLTNMTQKPLRPDDRVHGLQLTPNHPLDEI